MRTMFAALRYRDYRWLWLGLFISGVGDSMQAVGLGWLVVQLAVQDGVPNLAPFYIGLVGLSRAVPVLSLGLFAGVLADRFDRRRVLMATQFLGGVAALALAMLTLTGRASIGGVMLLSTLAACCNAFDLPARNAAIPRLVPAEDLMSAVGLYTATFNSAFVIGPMLAGILLVVVGISGLMFLNALSFVLAVLLMFLLKPLRPNRTTIGTSVFASLWEGLQYIRFEPAMRWVILLSCATCLLARPLQQLLPAYARDALGVGPVELSWLLTLFGAGSLGGALATASLGWVKHQGVALVGALLVLGLLDIAVGAQRMLVPALVLIGVPGFSQFIFSGFANTILQSRAPDQLRGRVMSVYTMTFQGVVPLGTLLLGSLGSLIGIGAAITVGGVALATCAGYVLLRVSAVRAIGASAKMGSAAPARA